MAKKQTRRSISYNRDLFDQAKAHAEAAGVPLARFAESALRAALAPAVPAAASQLSQVAAPRADDFPDKNGRPVADPTIEYDQH